MLVSTQDLLRSSNAGIGEVSVVVTNAIITSIVNSGAVRTPKSRPVLMTISPTNPRVHQDAERRAVAPIES